MVDGVHAHVHGVQQGLNGGENSALGPDEVVNIHLVDGDFPARFGFLRLGQHEAAHAVGVPADPAALPDEQALGVDDGAAEQLGNNVDDAGAADTHGLLARLAYDAEGGFHGVLVQGTGLNGPVSGAHTAGDVAALEGGTGGAGAGHQEVPVAEHDLAVGAQVDEQAQLVLVPDHAGHGTGGEVAAHVGADVRGNDDRGQGVGWQLHVPGQQTVPMEKAGYIRLHADTLGVHAHEQVVHGGVGTHGQAQNAPGGNVGGFAEIGDDRR